MKLKLINKKAETADVESLIFEPSEPLTWKAGQYLHYVLHHLPTDDRGSDRWFTVASAPHEKVVMITTRFNEEKSSSFKQKLRSLPIGDTIEISNVTGDFVVDDPNKEHVFIAGGIGVTPFHSILKEMDHAKQPINITLLYANRDENLIYKEEFESIASRNPHFLIHPIIAPNRIDGPTIQRLIPNLQTPIFYVSGPEPMVDTLGTTLQELGIPKEHIKQDWFPGYPAE